VKLGTIDDADGVEVVEGDIDVLYGITDSGAVLVRPDGHVAFRATASHDGAEAELRRAVAVATGRG
jgi:hypothetical protein